MNLGALGRILGPVGTEIINDRERRRQAEAEKAAALLAQRKMGTEEYFKQADLDEKRARLALDRAKLEADEAARYVDVPDMGRLPKEHALLVFKHLLEQRGREQTDLAEQQALGRLPAQLREAGTRMPEAGAAAEHELATVDPRFEALAKIVPMLGLKEAKAAVAGLAKPDAEEEYGATANYTYNKNTGLPKWLRPEPPEKPSRPQGEKVTRGGKEYRVTYDSEGNVAKAVEIGDAREPNEPVHQTVLRLREAAREAERRGDRALAAQHREDADALRVFVVPPGGVGIGAGGGRQEGPPITPSPPERKEIAGWQATIASLDSLIRKTEANKGVLGSIWTDPVAKIRRTVPYFSTPQEKEYLAQLATEISFIRKDLIGAAQTDQELRRLLDALPDADNLDISVIPKLKALRDYMRRQVATTQEVSKGFGVKTLPSKTINSVIQRLYPGESPAAILADPVKSRRVIEEYNRP